jgi:lysine 6-dehydrogenase
MKKIVVLGGGMIGASIAFDLHKKYEVTIADVNKKRLKNLEEKYSLKTIEADLSLKKNVQKVIEDADLVIGAVPGFLGFNTVKSVIEAGKDIVDISFFDEDPFLLDKAAKKHNVTAVVDCGVAPGMSNIILGYHNSKMKIEKFECMVGGLPAKRVLPFQYKAPFSPADVIEEYTRPARIIENGEVVVKPALSESEFVEIDPVGTLEAFNTDGLRSLLKTMNIKNMKEKTLRFPGHIDLMKALRDSGFFEKEEMQINGVKIQPLEFTSKLLFPKWKLEEGEKEFTVMTILIEGIENGKKIKYNYLLYDETDTKSGFSSMARTTGFTCSAAARLVIERKYIRKGISPPEYLGANTECFESILSDLKERKINYKKNQN